MVRDPKARSNAASVPSLPSTISRHGTMNETTATTVT